MAVGTCPEEPDCRLLRVSPRDTTTEAGSRSGRTHGAFLYCCRHNFSRLSLRASMHTGRNFLFDRTLSKVSPIRHPFVRQGAGQVGWVQNWISGATFVDAGPVACDDCGCFSCRFRGSQ